MTALLANEDSASYDFQMRDPDSPVAILAPHGGLIEWGTDQIAEAIAGDDYNLFCFNGHRLGGENLYYLHVRSHQYDEPRCRKLIGPCSVVIAIHGCKNPARGEPLVYLGGRNAD